MEIRIDLTPSLNAPALNAIIAALKTALGPIGKDIKLVDAAKLNAEIKSINDAARKAAEGIGGIGDAADKAASKGANTNKAFKFNEMIAAVQTVKSVFESAIGVGVEFEADLAAVGAITGLTGDKLDALGERARNLALEFGGGASEQLKSFQGILSKLGPAVAESPDALGKLAQNVNILSAASGDAADVSMSAMVDTMLQLGLVTGDANKDAETSTRVINALAASAKVGAAEIPQVAASMLQVGVAAKGANLGLEGTAAAIQVLSVGGKTGSEAGIALRNVLGLMQKASSESEKAMAKLGTSSAELGELLTTQGLDAALAKVNAGMAGLGSQAERNATLMTIFGTENAAAAGILLDNTNLLADYQAGIKAGEQGLGSAFEQAAIRMETSKTGIAQMEAAAKDALIGLAQFGGQAITTTLGAAASIAPMIASLNGLKDIFPIDGALKFGKTLLTDVLPSMAKMLFARLTGNAALVAETAAHGTLAVAKLTDAGATTGATAAQWLLNAAMAANPALLLVAGIGAVVGAFLLFSGGAKDLTEATEDANAAMKDFAEADATARAVEKQANELDRLADSYDNMATRAAVGIAGGDSLRAFSDSADQMAKVVPEAADTLPILNAAGEQIGETFTVNTGVVRAYADEQRRLAQEMKTEALARMNDEAAALGDSYREALVEQTALREDVKKYQEVVAAGSGSAILVGDFESASTNLKDINAELQEQNAKLKEAEPVIRAQVDQYQAMGLSTEEIATKLGFTNENLREGLRLVKSMGGDYKNIGVTADVLDKAIGGLPDKQQQAVRAAAQLSDQYASAKVELDKLNQDKAAKVALGADTKELDEQIKAAEKTFDDARNSVKAKFEDKEFVAGFGEGLKSLPEDARQQLGQIPGIMGEVRNEMKNDASRLDFGKALVDAESIKNNIDKTNVLQGLIDQFKNAGSEAEKADIAGKLNAQIPGFITGQNAVTGAMEVNLDLAQQTIDANSKAYGSDQAANVAAFESEVARLADSLTADEAAAAALAARIAEGTKQGKDVSALQGQYATLTTRIGDTRNTLNQTIDKGKGVGLLKGPVNEWAKSFGGARGKAIETAQSVGEIKKGVDNTTKSTKELVDEFSGMLDASKTAAKAAEAAVGLAFLQKKQGLISEEQYAQVVAQNAELVRQGLSDQTSATGALAQARADLLNMEKVDTKAILDSRKEGAKARDKDIDGAKTGKKEVEALASARRTAFDERVKQIDLESKRLETSFARRQAEIEGLSTEGVEGIRRARLEEELARDRAEETLRVAREKVAEYKRLFEVQGDGATATSRLTVALKESGTAITRSQLTDILLGFSELETKVAEGEGALKKFGTAAKAVGEDAIAEGKETRLQADIEAGKKTLDDLFKFYKEDNDRIRKAIETQRSLIAAQVDADVDGGKVLASEREKRIADLLESDATIRNYEKKIRDREAKIASEEEKRQKAALDARIALAQKAADDELRILENLANKVLSLEQKRTERQKQEIADRLKAEVDAGLKSQERATAEQARADAELDRQLEITQARIDGAKAEIDRHRESEALLERQRQLKSDIAALEAKGTDLDLEGRVQLSKLRGTLEEVEFEIADATGPIVAVGAQMQDEITNIFSNLFAGDEAAVKQPFKKVFATLVGAYQQLASAKITETLLSSIGPLPFPFGILAAVALKPAISGLINALISPILRNLTSFSTGGRIDAPTLALIGDASVHGGRNTEWVLRDEQLAQVVNSAAVMGQTGVIAAMNGVRQDIRALDGRFYVLERDVSTARGKNKRRVRERTFGATPRRRAA